MIFLFLFGLSNVIPSKISLYDKYIVTPIEEDTTPDDVFYLATIIGIIFFRVIILIASIYDLYRAFKYAVRYHVFMK
jgi:hypothetical protein